MLTQVWRLESLFPDSAALTHSSRSHWSCELKFSGCPRAGPASLRWCAPAGLALRVRLSGSPLLHRGVLVGVCKELGHTALPTCQRSFLPRVLVAAPSFALVPCDQARPGRHRAFPGCVWARAWGSICIRTVVLLRVPAALPAQASSLAAQRLGLLGSRHREALCVLEQKGV